MKIPEINHLDAETFDLLPTDASGDRFVMREGASRPWVAVTFGMFADGTPYIFSGGRATPRVASTEG